MWFYGREICVLEASFGLAYDKHDKREIATVRRRAHHQDKVTLSLFKEFYTLPLKDSKEEKGVKGCSLSFNQIITKCILPRWAFRFFVVAMIVEGISLNMSGCNKQIMK